MRNSTYPGRVILAIALISAGSLLLELTFVRIFSVLFFYHYGFLIISTSLFGMGLAGVVLHLRGTPSAESAEGAMRRAALLFALTSILAAVCTHLSPVKLSAAVSGQARPLIYLVLYYIILGSPFYFVGRAVSIGLTVWSERADQLYFGDLLGAGVGCLLLFVTLPSLMPMGTACIVSCLGIAAALLLSRDCGVRGRSMLVIALVASLGLSWFAGEIVPLRPQEHKRSFRDDYRKKLIEWTHWGVLSRVDVARRRDRKVLWIEGGTNESILIPFSGNFDRDFNKEAWGRRKSAFVYQIRKPRRVVIIGPAGSHEVVTAAGFGAEQVTGVEMDPLVVRAVVKDYADYIGRPYDHPGIRMVNEEGRSYLERCPDTFDVIQQINNFTPVAMASGALNVSETYLVTVEAFRLYLKRLTPDGIIDLRRHGDIRVASVAMEALRREGISEPWRNILILDDQTFVKKTPWTPEELQNVRILAKKWKRAIRFIPDEVRDPSSWYDGFLRSDHPEQWYHRDVANLTPSTDDWPFINHYVSWGRTRDPKLPTTIAWYNKMKFFRRVPHGDFVLVCILFEAAILSFLFLLLPMLRSRKDPLTPRAAPVLVYFTCLGAGFIFMELCLMQRLTLLLGHPSISLAVVLASLLIFAGLGSLLSGTLYAPSVRNLRLVLLISVIILVLGALFLQQLVRYGMRLPEIQRILLSIGISGIHGIFMGMPFPIALRIMSGPSHRLIPWGWAINAYATVVGSVLCVLCAMYWGFTAVYLLAAAAYGGAILTCHALKSHGELSDYEA